MKPSFDKKFFVKKKTQTFKQKKKRKNYRHSFIRRRIDNKKKNSLFNNFDVLPFIQDLEDQL